MQVFAHRGASGEYPENTLLAFEKAIEQQADGIEFDVQQAKDGLVITHDSLFTHQNQEYWLEDFTVAALQAIELPLNQSIATLSETLATIKGQCLCNVELKKVDDLASVKQTLGSAFESGLFKPEQIIVSSFNHHLLPTVQRWQLGVNTAAIIAANPIDGAKFTAGLNVEAVHAHVETVTPDFIDDVHKRGMQIRVYTVDHERDIRNLVHWGADAIFSNYPQRARQLIQALKNEN